MKKFKRPPEANALNHKLDDASTQIRTTSDDHDFPKLEKGGKNDASANVQRRGTLNWSVDGGLGSRQISTLGEVLKHKYVYDGVTGPSCKDQQPYQAVFRYQENLSTKGMTYVERWNGSEGLEAGRKIRSDFDVYMIILGVGINGVPGRGCEGGGYKTTGDFLIQTTLKIPRYANTRTMFYFRSVGQYWENQDGTLGTCKIQFFNDTNNQLLKTVEATEWLNEIGIDKRFTLSDIFNVNDVRPDLDLYRVEITHGCAIVAETLGGINSSGALIKIGLCNESARMFLD